MSNLIQINIHFKEIKRQMLSCFFKNPMLVDREKEGGSYNMEEVIRKGGR
jgi:hypothetical protein